MNPNTGNFEIDLIKTKPKNIWKTISFLLAGVIVSLSILIAMLYDANDKLAKSNDTLYKDNVQYSKIFDEQTRQYKILVNSGMSKERADQFIAEGCLHQLEIWR